jgi:WD40 repeat protein
MPDVPNESIAQMLLRRLEGLVVCQLESNPPRSADDTYLVAYGKGEACGWDTRTGKVERLALSKPGAVTVVCSHAQGSFLVGQSSGWVSLFTIQRFQGQTRVQVNPLFRAASPITALWSSTDTVTVAVGLRDGSVLQARPIDQRPCVAWRHWGPVRRLFGTTELYSAAEDGWIKSDALASRPTQPLPPLVDAALLGQTPVPVSLHADGSIWKWEPGRPALWLSSRLERPRYFLPDGYDRTYVSDDDGRLLSLTSSRPPRTSARGSVRGLLLANGLLYWLDRWGNLHCDEEQQTKTSEPRLVGHLACSGNLLWAGSDLGAVRRFELSCKTACPVPLPISQVGGDSHILICRDRAVSFYDCSAALRRKGRYRLDDRITHLAIGTEQGVTATERGQFVFWCLASTTPVRSIRITGGRLLALSSDAAGKKVVCSDSLSRLLFVEDGQTPTRFDLLMPVTALAPAPDGSWLAGHEDGSVSRVEYQSPPTELLPPLSVKKPQYRRVRWLARWGEQLWVCHVRTVRVDCPGTARGDSPGVHYPSPVTAVGFSPSGKWLVGGYATGEVIVWGASTRTSEPILAHSGPVELLQVSGRYLASAGRDRLIRVWQVDESSSTLTPVSAFLTKGIVTALSWLPTMPDAPRRLVFGDSRGCLELLELTQPQEALP